MNKIVLVSDSTCDLSKEIIEQRNIKIIPLYVTFDENTYRDGVDITTKELYEKVEQTGKLPKTSAISPGDFISFFEPFIEEGNEVIYISIGSKLSGTYNSANLAKDSFDDGKITVIDSKNLSSGIGLLVLKASDMINKGMTPKEIKEAVELLVPKVRSQFAIPTLDYLYKGGRCSTLSMLVGGVLLVKPIIQVKDGAMDVYKKAMGKMARALDIMLDDYEALKDEIDDTYVMITHSIAEKSSQYMIEEVNRRYQPKQLIETQAGCVISSHCGKGTIGILYLMK